MRTIAIELTRDELRALWEMVVASDLIPSPLPGHQEAFEKVRVAELSARMEDEE